MWRPKPPEYRGTTVYDVDNYSSSIDNHYSCAKHVDISIFLNIFLSIIHQLCDILNTLMLDALADA